MTRLLEAENLTEPVPNEFLILTPVPQSICTKRVTKGKVIRHRVAKNFSFKPVRYETAEQLFDMLEKLQSKPYCFVVRGHPTKSTDLSCDVRRILRKTGEGTIQPVARTWVTLDIDALPASKKSGILANTFDPQDPETTIRDVIELLPAVFHEVSCHWRYSSSAGFKKDSISCHITFVLDTAISDLDLKRYFQTFNEGFIGVYGRRLIDPALYNPIQPHYTAAPILEGVEDPMPHRSGIMPGRTEIVPISNEWIVPDDEAAEDRRYMTFLGRVGDDQDGFHHPIMQGIASWINFHGEPESNARTELKRLVRSYIQDAEVSKERSQAEVDRYASDEFLDTLIDGAINKGFSHGFKSKVDLSELLKSYIYITYEEVMYDPIKDLGFTLSAIKHMHASMAPNKNIAKLLVESPDLRTVDTCEFVPGTDSELSMLKGRRIYNKWKPRRVAPSSDAGDVGLFLDHLSYLVDGDEGGYRHLTSCIAHTLANPGRRLRHAVVLGSLVEGTGKSYLKKVFEGIIGADQVMEVGTDQLKEKFNKWATNTEIVFIEELMAGGRLEISNRIKPMISEDNITVRGMNTDSYKTNNPASFFCTTNHSNAIILDKDSRRYWVWMSPARPHPSEYYKKLFKWTSENLSLIYRWALDYDLSDFDPEAPPPKTKHFHAMVGETTRPIDAFIVECIENVEWPLSCDLINPTDLAQAMNTAPGFRGINPISMAQTLKRLGIHNLGTKRMMDGKKAKIWAVRNIHKWSKIGEKELAMAYNPPGDFDARHLDI